MVATNFLFENSPDGLAASLKQLGQNLKTARIRRNMTLAEMSESLGVGRDTLAAAEGGKLTTSIGVYAGMLWALDLLGDLDAVADPTRDEHGLALERLNEQTRASGSRFTGGMSNDF